MLYENCFHKRTYVGSFDQIIDVPVLCFMHNLELNCVQTSIIISARNIGQFLQFKSLYYFRLHNFSEQTTLWSLALPDC